MEQQTEAGRTTQRRILRHYRIPHWQDRDTIWLDGYASVTGNLVTGSEPGRADNWLLPVQFDALDET